MTDGDRRDLEETTALLAGHAITRVRYLGWWHAAPEEPGAYVEYVELTMDDGAVVRVSSDPDESGVDAISIYEGPYPSSPAGVPDPIRSVDAGGTERWRPLLGPVVSKAGIHWAAVDVVRVDVRRGAEPERPSASLASQQVVVPSALELRFGESGSVFLTAASWGTDGTLILDSDNVAVVFGDAEAERLGVGFWRAGSVKP